MAMDLTFDRIFGNLGLLEVICSYLPVATIGKLTRTRTQVHIGISQLPLLARELLAAKQLVNQYGFSPQHMTLLREYLSKQVQDEEGLSWAEQKTFWNDRVQQYHDQIQNNPLRSLRWIKAWSADCTDASQQRSLVALPNETISCKVDYVNSHLRDTCIIQLQIGIDYYRIPEGNRGDVSQVCYNESRGNALFQLIAPEQPGLYMIWQKESAQYSFQDAAEYHWHRECATPYLPYKHGFLAWLRVDPQATPKPRGDRVYFLASKPVET
eukprot:CAMPEP_0194224666 /NCGR_PEP_ID=MMETSP0156-20130528/37989_1 /TAXON_ID=33649 /ORGANISM="Thalassionema nitzschioides, Strain L26-B" /LENGTH=267 /DNA_ID=CAMNT_0038956341 /DNA_START=38 /DNA_END=841 /DNA_ORIENTATION=-